MGRACRPSLSTHLSSGSRSVQHEARTADGGDRREHVIHRKSDRCNGIRLFPCAHIGSIEKAACTNRTRR
jgi:hypothetical protein